MKYKEVRMMKVLKVREVRIGEGLPKICVPIVGKTKEEIEQMVRKVQVVPCDLVEFRADWFENVLRFEEVKEVLQNIRALIGNIPIIFTFRTALEGGEFEIEVSEYEKLLLYISRTGLADIIDVEVYHDEVRMEKLIYRLKENGSIILASNHDFNTTPKKTEIINRLCGMQNIGADINKIAVMPNSVADVCELMMATEEVVTKYATNPVVTMSMGEVGMISRVSGELTGSAITFGCLDKSSAPGQIDVNGLRQVLEIMHRD